jgi:hypothetical protein
MSGCPPRATQRTRSAAYLRLRRREAAATYKINLVSPADTRRGTMTLTLTESRMGAAVQIGTYEFDPADFLKFGIAGLVANRFVFPDA